MTELISVHTPKCAGISLREALIAAYGAARTQLDYEDRPLDPVSEMNIDPVGYYGRWRARAPSVAESCDVIHGHFNARKYDAIDAARVTFLRHPIDRLVSHYRFWQATPPEGHALHRYVIDHSLSLVEFARLPLIRRLYTGVFFAGVDMHTFDFVGLAERYAEDVARLSALIGRSLDIRFENASPSSADDVLVDERQRATLERLLADDIAFYERQAQRFH